MFWEGASRLVGRDAGVFVTVLQIEHEHMRSPFNFITSSSDSSERRNAWRTFKVHHMPKSLSYAMLAHNNPVYIPLNPLPHHHTLKSTTQPNPASQPSDYHTDY